MWQIEELVARINADPKNIGRMSCGETIAMAFIFNRLDWLPAQYKHTAAAIGRLGAKWCALVAEYNQEHGDLEVPK